MRKSKQGLERLKGELKMKGGESAKRSVKKGVTKRKSVSGRGSVMKKSDEKSLLKMKEGNVRKRKNEKNRDGVKKMKCVMTSGATRRGGRNGCDRGHVRSSGCIYQFGRGHNGRFLGRRLAGVGVGRERIY